MSSGKQLSFQQGEISPTLRYRSDAVSYAAGLAKLTNMFVRRDGGVANRPGFEFSSKSQWQFGVSEVLKNRKIRSFYTSEGVITFVKTANFTNKVYIDGLELTSMYYESTTWVSCGIKGPADIESIRVTETKDGVFVTPACESFTARPTPTTSFDPINLVYGFNILIKGGVGYLIQKNEYLNAAYTGSYGMSGSAPWLPASYLMTAVLKDGREVYISDIKSEKELGLATWGADTSGTRPGGVTIFHPHADLMMYWKRTFTNIADIVDVKFFNLYHASGAGGLGKSYYKLCARLNNPGDSTSFYFHDYGSDDPSITPPLDTSIFVPDSVAGTPYQALTSVGVACYHQQRLLMSIGAAEFMGIKRGEIFASALGAPRQVSGPLVFSNTGAFRFSVPEKDGSDVVAMLSMERAIAFTKKGVYIMRGGDQGAITPLEVNPLRISDEGCSTLVAPVTAGSRGFWINYANTKLMTIEYGIDGNATVSEASLLSNHFLKNGVVQIESTSGEEDTVYMLTQDGKIIQVTVGEDGAFGFSLIETNGYVESIYAGDFKLGRTKDEKTGGKVVGLYAPDGTCTRSPEVLYAYVIRKGVRYLEYLSIREDRFKQQENFADCSLTLGTRLLLTKTTSQLKPGYFKEYATTPWVGWTDTVSPWGQHINIEAPIAGSHSWLAGQTIKIRTNVQLNSYFTNYVIHFYYDETDADGNVSEKLLRYVINTAVAPVATGESVGGTWAYTALGYEYEGYFTSDVPTVLRNVRGTYTTANIEFFNLQTRWLPAFNSITQAAGGNLEALYNIGPKVTVVGEGDVLSSPLNPNRTADDISITKDGSNYTLALGDYYSWSYAGIPYTCEFETLDIEASDERTLSDSHKLINAVGVAFHESRGGFYGMPNRGIADMEEFQFRDENDIAVQDENVNGYMTIHMPAEYNKSGRVNIKHVDPTPLTILSVFPKGIAGD